MKVHISYTHALNHLIDIRIDIDGLSDDETIFKLPTWRPGRYELQNFAKNMYRVYASDDNRTNLLVRKISRNAWQVSHKGKTSITLSYQYYAHTMDAGGSWLDDEQLYINFINCILYTDLLLNEPIDLFFTLPDNYRVATGLKPLNARTFSANNYHQLVDSPIIASASLKELTYSINGTFFHIWFQGAGKINEQKIIADFSAFSKAQIELFNGFPTSDYHFLVQLLPYPKYHGVEHSNSTVITLGADIDLSTEKAYTDFLGISSHELFHVWNIKRIRPKELSPYNYDQETYFNTGFIAEGVTTYYGDLMLFRSGVFTEDQFLLEVNQYLSRYINNPGRESKSLAESSHDLWVDGYGSSAPKRKVSIYIKGALVAMILDVELRSLKDKDISLDDVMRQMWSVFPEGSKGYTAKDYQDIIEQLSDLDWNWYMDELIYGRISLIPYLEDMTRMLDLKFKRAKNPDSMARTLGIRLNNNSIVIGVAENSPAEGKIGIGDKIKIIKNQESINQLINDQNIKCSIKRFGRKILMNFDDLSGNFYAFYKIERKLSDNSIDKKMGALSSFYRLE